MTIFNTNWFEQRDSIDIIALSYNIANPLQFREYKTA